MVDSRAAGSSPTTADQPSVGGPLAVAGLSLGLVTWPLAFNLGAYGQVFYQDVFRLVVAASILLVIVIVRAPYSGLRIWFLRAALASPLLWLLTAGYVVGSTSDAMRRPEFIAWLVITLVVSVPLAVLLLVDLFTPQLSRARSSRTKAAVLVLVAVVGLTGFLAGRENARFLTCADFAVAGSSEPDGCAGGQQT